MPSTVRFSIAGANDEVSNHETTTTTTKQHEQTYNVVEEGQDTTVIRFKPRRQRALLNASGTHPYTFIVYTSKKHCGVTDGDVIVIVYGAKTRRGVGFVLKKESAQGVAFLDGQKDYFSVQSKHLGTINKVKIKPANKANFKDWFLRKIIISDEATNTEYCFICKKKIFSGNSSSYKMTVDGYIPTGSEAEYPVRAKKLHFKPKAKVITLPPEHKTLHKAEGLSVLDIDTMVEMNSTLHHTHKFRLDGKPSCLVLRRGLPFTITIKLSKDSSVQQGAMYFIAISGSRPRLKENTLINIFECSQDEYYNLNTAGKWGYYIKSSNNKEIVVEIFIPVSTIPSRYKLILKDDHTTHEFEAPMFILYNPWNKADEVYMDDEQMRIEYVMKQNGIVYIGGSRKPRARSWYFGQFEEVALDAAFMLLEDAKPTRRDTIVDICRRLMALVNHSEVNDSCGGGVLSGNWSGNYEGGRPPSYWNSTPAILEIYLTTGQPVKWGQCWVYSAILNTVLRTLGVPCRCVTNFYSAHDKNGYCTYDVYLDAKGEKIKNLTNDSIWNFHVWNDVWMERKDLPPEYSGWQIVDATPQERSQGFVQMGPASVRAVKEGDIELPYDTAFVLAEVNADKLYKQQNSAGEWEVIGFDQNSIGMNISTKGLGANVRADITEEYKHLETSVLERATVKKALVKTQNHAFRECNEDIRLELIPVEAAINVGDDVSLNVHIHNASEDRHTIKLKLCGYIVRYDGVSKAQLQKYSETIIAAPEDSTESTFTVHASQYLSYLEDETMIKFVATASVQDTGQVTCEEELVDIIKPSLKITGLPEQLLAGVTQEFVISLTNPLDTELTDCEIYIDGSIIPTRIYVKGIRDIPPGGKLVEPVRLTPHIPIMSSHNKAVRSTKKSMTVSFTCKELGGLNETLKVFVINIK